jgi:hypothetical protein
MNLLGDAWAVLIIFAHGALSKGFIGSFLWKAYPEIFEIWLNLGIQGFWEFLRMLFHHAKSPIPQFLNSQVCLNRVFG